MNEVSSAAMAIGMVTAFLLLVGGVRLTLARHTRSRGVLMVVTALVIIMNVMIATV